MVQSLMATLIVVAVAFCGYLLAPVFGLTSFSDPPPSSAMSPIQQIAATQNAMLVEQQKTNQLLTDLLKAQGNSGR